MLLLVSCTSALLRARFLRCTDVHLNWFCVHEKLEFMKACKMLVMFPPIFVADTKILYGHNFVTPLSQECGINSIAIKTLKLLKILNS